MSRWRKGGILAVAGMVLLLVLLHTQPFESLLMDQLASRLPPGYTLTVERLDLNLFRLSARLKGVRLDGDVAAQIEEIEVNANQGVLKGRIDLHSLRLARGFIEIRPPSKSSQKPTKPFTLPPVSLGKASVEGVVLKVKDQTAALDLGFADLNLGYEGDLLNLAFTSLPMALGGRELPSFAVRASGVTKLFDRFDQINLDLASASSQLAIKGNYGWTSGPFLDLAGELGPDLVPGLQGIQVSGSLDPTWIKLKAETLLPLSGTPSLVQVNTRFAYLDPKKHIPIQVCGDLVEGEVLLEQGPDGLSGSYQLSGNRATLAALHKELNGLEGVELTGTLALGGEKGPLAQARLKVVGTPNLDLDMNWEGEAGRFHGTGSPVAGSQLSLAGTLTSEKVAAQVDLGLDSLASLKPWITLPSELRGGPAQLHLKGTSDYENWALSEGSLVWEELGFAPWLEPQRVQLTLSGKPDRLVGQLEAPRLHPSKPVALFTLDLNRKRLTSLEVGVDAQNLFLAEGFRYDLTLDVSGSGPLTGPNLDGTLSAMVVGDAPVGHFDAPFEVRGNKVKVPALSLETAHGMLQGHLLAKLGKTVTWETNLKLQLEKRGAFKPLITQELPTAQLLLEGDQDNLTGRLLLPGQELSYDRFATATTDVDVTLAIKPGQVLGNAPEWTVAGIGFSRFGFGLRQGQFRAETHFRVTDSLQLKAALGDLWPSDLALSQAEGDLRVTGKGSSAPKVTLELYELLGSYCQAPIRTERISATYDGQVRIEPFKGHVAGVDLAFDMAKVPGAKNQLKPGEEGPVQTLALATRFSVSDPELLHQTLGLPESVVLTSAQGQLQAFADQGFANPMVVLSDFSLDAGSGMNLIRLENLGGSYGNGLWLTTGTGYLNDLPLEIHPTRDGFSLSMEPSVNDIDRLKAGFVGNAQFGVELEVHNEADGHFSAELIARQKEGSLVLLDPWLVITDLKAAATYTHEDGLHLHETQAQVNGGKVLLTGAVIPEASGYDMSAGIVADGVILDLVDLRVNFSSALEWHADETENKIRATAYLNEGYLAPNKKVKELVGGLLNAVNELNFPDPSLEKVQIEGFVATKSPFIVETDIAYLEVESPWLIIGGTLAKPSPKEGFVTINRGSSLDLKNQALVFQDSQVQFLKNRPDDPYLLVSLVSADDANKSAINLTGFSSELGQQQDTQNLTALLANYLVGQGAMVSLEADRTNSVYDDSLNFVVSKKLTRRVVTRYSVPVTKTGQQRAELSVGPFRNNFINVTNQRSAMGGDIQHSRKFGYPAGKKPLKIHKVTWPEDTPKWVRRSFKLRRDQVYSETLWRRASLSLIRRLKEDGYLEPVLTHTWSDGVLAIDLAFGPQTSLEVQGLIVTKAAEDELFRTIPSLDALGLRVLEARIERMAVTQGHLSAAAMARREGTRITVQTFLSEPIRDTQLSFGQANLLLGPLYKEKDARAAFMSEYLLSADDARARLRARLAALGYLVPELESGTFLDLNNFELPIRPGPKAILAQITENGKPLKSPFVGKPFNYGVIAKVASEFGGKGEKTYLVTLTPRRVGSNAVLELKRTEMEETIVASLNVSGSDRIPAEKIRRYMGFKPGMTQEEVIEAQQDLLLAGPFASARLQAGKDATLEVQERNRFDADYLVSWDEEKEYGHALQFKDYQLFHGFNSLAVRMEQSKIHDDFYGRLKFDRVWGSRLDITAGYNWRQEKEGDATVLIGGILDPFETKTSTSLGRLHKPILEFGYPLTPKQRLALGASYERRHIRTIEDAVFGGVTERTESFAFSQLLPVSLSWVYRNLDQPISPKNGLLLTFSGEYFTDQGDATSYTGPRYKTGISSFKTWGPFTWSNRIESGIFRFGDASERPPDDPRTTPYFLLGGSTTIRGYRQDLVGPLLLSTDAEGLSYSADPLGGRAMFFSSQELTFNTGFVGLGITPFVDGGWVWADYRDLLKTDLLITGGLGLSFDTPVGYFRVDWAKPLDDRAIDDQFSTEGDLDTIKDTLETQFYLRFGRVF